MMSKTARQAPAAARAAAVAALAGRSPQEAGMQKALSALVWVYRWGYSTASLLDAVGGTVGAPRRGLAARLVRQGLLHRRPIWTSDRRLPRALLLLTDSGVAAVEAADPDTWWPSWSPRLDRLPPYEDAIIERQIVHDVAVQKIVLEYILSGRMKAFRPPREMKTASKKGQKQPDALCIIDGKRCALELELTRKKPGKEWDDTRLALLLALKENVYDFVLYVTPSRYIADYIQSGYAADAEVRRWGYDAARHLIVRDTETVPPALAARVQVVLRKDLP